MQPAVVVPATLLPELFTQVIEPTPDYGDAGEAVEAAILGTPVAESMMPISPEQQLSVGERLDIYAATLEPELASTVAPLIEKTRETAWLVAHLREVEATPEAIAEVQAVLEEYCRELCLMLGVEPEASKVRLLMERLILGEFYHNLTAAQSRHLQEGTHEQKFFALEYLSTLAIGLVDTVQPAFYFVGRLALGRVMP
jgi:hypothetical protein